MTVSIENSPASFGRVFLTIVSTQLVRNRDALREPSGRVYVRVPSDRRVTKAHLLVAGNEIPFTKKAI